MRKGLILILAALLATALLIGCKEQGAEKAVDPKVLAEVSDNITKTADKLDLMNKKAYGMGQLGATMAQAEPAAAAATLDEALAIAKDVHSAANKAKLEDFTAQTKDWPAKQLEQVEPQLMRIEIANSRVWVIRSIAEGVAKLDKGKAKAILVEAASMAEGIKDKRYRDMDLRGVSAALAPMDAQAAMGVADKIADMRVKAYAQTVIGAETGSAAILDTAAATAKAIAKMEVESELTNEASKPEVKESVKKADEAKLAVESAKALCRVALAVAKTDQAKAKALFNDANGIAQSIDAPYAKAYATSEVAMAIAGFDPELAASLAEKIPDEVADARFAALLKVAKAKTAMGKPDQAAVEKAADVAEKITDPYYKVKAQAEAAAAMVAVNKQKAAEMAEPKFDELKKPVSYPIEDPGVTDETLAKLAVSLDKENPQAAEDEMGKIYEPRFANRYVLYVKAKALADMADARVAKDPEGAKKLYNKAASVAADAKASKLQWRIAAAYCKLDQDKLFDMAAKLESDNVTRALGLAEIAADWSSRNDGKAGMVWDMAMKTAGGESDDYAGAELIGKVASRCAQYDKARAAAMFTAAKGRIAKVGQAL